jgi:hypothetical protein
MERSESRTESLLEDASEPISSIDGLREKLLCGIISRRAARLGSRGKRNDLRPTGIRKRGE